MFCELEQKCLVDDKIDNGATYVRRWVFSYYRRSHAYSLELIINAAGNAVVGVFPVGFYKESITPTRNDGGEVGRRSWLV